MRYLRPRLLLALAGLAGSAFGTVGAVAATSATASSASAAVTVAPGAGQNPYEPSYGHSYRHGAEPSLSQQAKIHTWDTQHPAGHANASAAVSADTMGFQGGINGGEGAVTSKPKVYLVFWGSQWGSSKTDSNGNATFSGDYDGGAPYIQQMFKGLGTGGELWSGTMTQYCDGPTVAKGATSCPSGAPLVGYPYPTGGSVLAGVWYDNTAQEPDPASVQQIADEAYAAAGHFGNTTAASNRYAQYDVLSAPGLDPDLYMFQGFCAWHDWATSSYGDLAFTNMPYVMDVGPSCGENFVNTSNGLLDGYSIVNGHEYAETLTDEFPSAGWVDSAGNEVGDVCAWIGAGNTGAAADVTMSTGAFAMQSIWSNDTDACAISHPIVTSSSGNTVSVTNPGNQTGTVGTATSLQISASDSQSGQTLTYSASGLPAGLSINSITGLISGTPTSAATPSVTVTATDTTGASGSASFTWTINPAAANTVTVTNPGSQSGTVGSVANLQISAHDSQAGQTFTYSATGLPSNLSISSSSGLITGTEMTAGTYSVTVTATDTTNASGSATFTWTVSASGTTVTVTNPGSQSSTQGTATKLQIVAKDSQSTQTMTYTATGLPAGLSINASTGSISGTPTTARTYTVTVTATDTTGAHGSATFSWTIHRRRSSGQ